MILDAIIALLASVFDCIAGAAAIVFVPIINLFIGVVEAIVGFFVSGFSLSRIERKKSSDRPLASAIWQSTVFVLLTCAIAWLFVVPKILNRKLTMVGKDGHSLPFAALIIHTDDGDQHERTDNSGNIRIPRFSTTGVTVKDPRYIENTWTKNEIESQLIVGRTILGSGLDALADRLLMPAKE